MNNNTLIHFLAWRRGRNFAYGKRGELLGDKLKVYGHRRDGELVPIGTHALEEGDIIWEANNLADYFVAVNAGIPWEKVTGTNPKKKELSARGVWHKFADGALRLLGKRN